jgi:hypothetical protein
MFQSATATWYINTRSAKRTSSIQHVYQDEGRTVLQHGHGDTSGYSPMKRPIHTQRLQHHQPDI